MALATVISAAATILFVSLCIISTDGAPVQQMSDLGDLMPENDQILNRRRKSIIPFVL